jgi:menaquinone-dependent protoporphyrinogen IX oxidase
MKGIIIYKSKYGATKQYADWLGELLHIPSVFLDHFHKGSLPDYDFVVLGSSVYIGKLLIRDWLMQNINEVQLKKVFLFIVCGTDPGEKDKIEKIVKDNLPGELKSKFEIYFLSGRLRRNNLSWSDKLLLKIGAFLAKDPKDKNNMKKDYDLVKKENLLPLLNSVGKYAQGEEKRNPVSTPI